MKSRLQSRQKCLAMSNRDDAKSNTVNNKDGPAWGTNKTAGRHRAPHLNGS